MSAPLSWPGSLVWPPGYGDDGCDCGQSALDGFKHFLAKCGGRIRDPDARGPHGVDLELGGVLATGDHGAGMAHAATRRRGAAGDEADHRLRGLRRLEE